MQSVAIKLRNAKPDHFRSSHSSTEAAPNKNIALTSTIFRRPMGKCVTMGVVTNGIVDFPATIAHPNKEWIARFAPCVAVLATVGNYARLSVRYRMKVK